jgi:hypothetical protein
VVGGRPKAKRDRCEEEKKAEAGRGGEASGGGGGSRQQQQRQKRTNRTACDAKFISKSSVDCFIRISALGTTT